MNFLPSNFKISLLVAIITVFGFASSAAPELSAKNGESKNSKARLLANASKKAREQKAENNDRKRKNLRAEQAKKGKSAEARKRGDFDRRQSAKASSRSGRLTSKTVSSKEDRRGALSKKSSKDEKERIAFDRAAREKASKKVTRRQREEQRRVNMMERAEAARITALARQRNAEQSLRDDVKAMIARDDLTGEDPEVRQAAINALGNRAGTVVVMDPKSGRVYSIVNQEWAVREGFKPCSTIKLVTGLAGLNEDVIDPTDPTNISYSNIGSLTNALAYSKNGYFQGVGGQVGFDKMVSYARQLGLGEKTGINMRNEIAGNVPSPGARSGIARISSHGDNFQVTPLQLATLVSAIGNGGKLVAPYVIRSRQDELKFRTKVRRQIPIESKAWLKMIPGMVGAVNYGSGRKAHDPSQTVAGKTGTCIERGGWVGLFTSYAPLANPTLAVVVITRGADARAHLPAAVAGRIYRDLSVRFGTTANPQFASMRKSFTQDLKVSRGGQTQALTLEISDADRNELGNRTPLMSSRSGSTNSHVKPVLMQIPTRTPAVVKPQNDHSEQVIPATDGQTRPRRVSGMN